MIFLDGSLEHNMPFHGMQLFVIATGKTLQRVVGNQTSIVNVGILKQKADTFCQILMPKISFS